MDDDTLVSLSEGIRYKRDYEALYGDKTMEQYMEEETAFNLYCENWNSKADKYREEHPDAGWEEINRVFGPFEWNPPAGPGSPYRPAGLADSMLAAVAPAVLTAVLFYQGEEDTARTDQYDVLMTAMIRYWRKIFRNAELPFLFVQLPMWLDNGAEDSYTWPRTRLAQAAVRDSVRNTGMVCLLDQGEYGNIHPTAKRPVGERLADLAGVLLYGGGEVSPRVLDLTPQGDALILRLSAPVQLRGDTASLLEIAEADGPWIPARAEVCGAQLLLRADDVRQPLHARYAWTDYASPVPFFGENGLPLEPFDL
jgi:sialate O-acetylesterase